MKAVCLMSGGIDSPVAAKLVMDRGVKLYFLHGTIDGKRDKIKRLVSLLDKKAEIRFYDQRAFLERAYKKIDKKYICLLCKRNLYRQAEAYAKEVGAEFIVTGEALGQVASQTLDNLYVLESAITIPVIRPLIGMNKEEIVKIAKKIGTYEISIKGNKRCPFVPSKPSTAASIDKVVDEESKLN